MREKIYTIPVNDAFLSADECPFCWLERETEQKVINFTLGPTASYMEPDVRSATNCAGFCGVHLKKMYDFGNALGNALILQTYMDDLLEELRKEIQDFQMPPKRSIFGKKTEQEESTLLSWAREKQDSCYVCDKIEYNMARYYETMFYLLKEPEFRKRLENCKGFCMRHFLRILEEAKKFLPNEHREWFYETLFSLMKENMDRVKGDLDWFIAKFDYRNAGADWKNSKDAVSRTMQKLQGLHPADPVFRSEPR